jgi:hypothetical protein
MTRRTTAILTAAAGCVALLGGESRALAQFGVGFLPIPAPAPDGVVLPVLPVVSADRRYVRLSLTPQFFAFDSFSVVPVPAAVGGGPGGPGALGGLGGGGGAGAGGGGGGGGVGVGGVGVGAAGGNNVGGAAVMVGGPMAMMDSMFVARGYTPTYGGIVAPRQLPTAVAMADRPADEAPAPIARPARRHARKAAPAKAPAPVALADPSKKATSLLRQGEALAKDGHPTAARAYFRELVRDYPGTPQAARAAEKAADLAAKERVR